MSARDEGRADMTGAIVLPLRDGAVSIEGVVQRVEDRIGRAALDRLVELIERDGPAALAVAQGDFVAMVTSGTQTHAFKSFTSQFQIYYRESDRLVANRLFAFRPAGEAAWNEDYFARHVLIVPGYQFLSRETPLRDVFRVLPGELVCIGRGVERTQLARRRYAYRFDAGMPREEAAREVLRLLRDSIATRIAARPEARVCVEISGGLDSSFIACLLGEAIPTGVRGVMFSQPRVPSHAVSEQYARDVADRYGIELLVVPPEELPAGPPERFGYADEPSDFFWFGDIFSRAVADAAEPHSFVFTGFGADQLFLRSPAFLPLLLKARRTRAFLETLPEVSSLLSRGRLSIAWQCLLSQIPANVHRRLQRASVFRRWNPWDVSDVNMERTLTDEAPWLTCGKGLDVYSFERRLAEADITGDGILCDDWGYFTAPRVVTQPHFAAKDLLDASPFCDLPLMDHVYDNVSALVIHDFGGRYKEFLREAQNGVVPETLRNRRNDTFVFNSFQLSYVNASRDRFEDLLDSVDDGWIDAKGARHALQQLAFGMQTSSTRSLMALMGYLQWRRTFDDHCKSPDALRDRTFFEARCAGR